MFEQITIFDLINPDEKEADDGTEWTTLCVDKEQGIYRFPEETGEWQPVEILVKYENDSEPRIEVWHYRDHTFRTDGPYRGTGEGIWEILKWRLKR